MQSSASARLLPHRPLSYWLEHSPPGWISNRTAERADPLALASEIHGRLRGLICWLRKPESERWDTHALQSFSAALFNRYRARRSPNPGRMAAEKSLEELAWPAGSDEIRACLSGLQLTTAAPLAVFKAVRLPATDSHPTADELRFAHAALLARLTILDELAVRLNAAMERYSAALRRAVPASAGRKALDSSHGGCGTVAK
jgi:hypothetical protein